MRVIRSLLAFLFVLIGAAAVVLTLALFLASTGRSLPMLRAVVTAAGRCITGQQTTALSLTVRLQPEARRLAGTARLTVRANGRQLLYFLLNPGLHVEAAWEEAANGARSPLQTYRLWMLTVVELPRALAADEEIRVGLDYAGEPRGSEVGGQAMVWQTDDVALLPADFWYPADLQGFFTADVEVMLPADLTLVHNGSETVRSVDGTSARVRFATERPVPGLALIAGRYQAQAGGNEALRLRVLLPADVHLDAARLFDALATSNQILTAHFGSAGFSQLTLCVNRRFQRAFNDGTGLVGMPPLPFADGAYGFPTIAHEVAHNWWGATVTEQWLQPGTGGEWIVEGFAELSSWLAIREQLGDAALLRTLAHSFFDPDRTGSLAAASALDNGLDPAAHATIYHKGGYVAFMLQQQLGDEKFDAAARQFLDQFRWRSATASDLETVFVAASQQDLAPFFNAWVRGNESIDLALDPQEGGAVVRNHRTAPAPASLALWRFPAGDEPEKRATSLGATEPIGDARRIVLDPLAAVADMFRSNNVIPRHDNPRAVSRSAHAALMVVSGEPYPWEPATIEVTQGDAKPQSWVIDGGLLADPVWSADGTRILAVESPHGAEPTLLALNLNDGSRRTISHDTTATGTADGTIVARGARLLRIAGDRTTQLAEHPGGRITAPLAAPTAGTIAYAVIWDSGTMDLRVLSEGDPTSRVLFTWPAAPLRWVWSPDGTHLFAALPGDWDWQLWELSLDGSAPRVLESEAAGISDLAVSPDGDRIAVVAQADVDDHLNRSEVFVVERHGSGARPFDLAGRTAFSAAWLDESSLVVVTADPTYASLPVHKELRTVHLSDGSLEPFRPSAGDGG
jgi:hypothetical protein